MRDLSIISREDPWIDAYQRRRSINRCLSAGKIHRKMLTIKGRETRAWVEPKINIPNVCLEVYSHAMKDAIGKQARK